MKRSPDDFLPDSFCRKHSSYRQVAARYPSGACANYKLLGRAPGGNGLTFKVGGQQNDDHPVSVHESSGYRVIQCNRLSSDVYSGTNVFSSQTPRIIVRTPLIYKCVLKTRRCLRDDQTSQLQPSECHTRADIANFVSKKTPRWVVV